MKDIVLVGGGHAHVQVLRRQMMSPLPGARFTVLVDEPVAVYSGMVPGFVAGNYAAHELEIDVRPLARRAGARVVVARATRIDAQAREVHVEGRPPVRYDLCSLNVGSSVAGLDTPGVREHAIATRPIAALCQRVDARIEGVTGRFDVVVVGGGAAGVELAFSVRERLLRAGAEPRVRLLESGARILSARGASLSARVEAAARRRGIELLTGVRVARVEADRVVLTNGSTVAADLTVWAAGAAAPSLIRASSLPMSGAGFALVRDTLQVLDHDDLFAVGDCAVPASWPEIPKAGVYAVRQGPALADNLRACVRGEAPRAWRPQRDFLALLNLGDGTAIGSKWGLTLEGRAVFAWKDRIDRRFVERFQVLGGSGAVTSAFADMPDMEAPCGGCAAKVADQPLRRALSRLPPRPDPDVLLGVHEADDVAAVRHGGEAIVLNVDAFPAFTDDPWLVGRVAAVNAASDLQAKGVAPRHALAIVILPADEPPEALLHQVLLGARAALDPEGVALVGGHTTVGEGLSVGFAVVGFAGEAEILRNTGLVRGDRLVLTRALGTGVLFHADMRGLARGAWIEAAIAGMVRGNGPAGRVASQAGARAVTDVTGFGLAGHLAEMLRGGAVSATVHASAVPALPGALELLARGERSTFHAQNGALRGGLAVRADGPALELLFDPQTAGGLLIGVAEDRVEALLKALHSTGDVHAAMIGRVTPPRADGALFAIERGSA